MAMPRQFIPNIASAQLDVRMLLLCVSANKSAICHSNLPKWQRFLQLLLRNLYRGSQIWCQNLARQKTIKSIRRNARGRAVSSRNAILFLQGTNRNQEFLKVLLIAEFPFFHFCYLQFWTDKLRLQLVITESGGKAKYNPHSTFF